MSAQSCCDTVASLFLTIKLICWAAELVWSSQLIYVVVLSCVSFGNIVCNITLCLCLCMSVCTVIWVILAQEQSRTSQLRLPVGKNISRCSRIKTEGVSHQSAILFNLFGKSSIVTELKMESNKHCMYACIIQKIITKRQSKFYYFSFSFFYKNVWKMINLANIW